MNRKKFNPYDLNHVAQVHNLNMSSDRDEVHAMREERAYQQGFADGKREAQIEAAEKTDPAKEADRE